MICNEEENENKGQKDKLEIQRKENEFNDLLNQYSIVGSVRVGAGCAFITEKV